MRWPGDFGPGKTIKRFCHRRLQHDVSAREKHSQSLVGRQQVVVPWQRQRPLYALDGHRVEEDLAHPQLQYLQLALWLTAFGQSLRDVADQCSYGEVTQFRRVIGTGTDVLKLGSNVDQTYITPKAGVARDLGV